MNLFSKKITINKFLLIAIVYFFFNSFLLPSGLLYTTVLTPFFLFYTYNHGSKNIILTFILLVLPYFLIHFYLGTALFYYIKSTILVSTVFVFIYAFALFLKENKVEHLYPSIIKLNLLFVIVAVFFFFTDYKDVFWYLKKLTLNVRGVPRLKMLTYEPSYYSLIFAPIAIYYFLKILLTPTTWKVFFICLISIGVPLLLSFSLGVISGIVISFLLLILFFFFRLIKFKKVFYSIIIIVVSITAALLLLLVFYPDNPLYARLIDLLNGQDTSALGRTFYAIQLAFDIAERKSLWFGVGFGQIKIIGTEIIREFYNYSKTDIAAIRIPNAIGETIAMFGITGLIIRLSLQVFFFFKTKVYTNYYRFTIFSFVFVYQFSGSFFHNPVELVLWVIAFSSGFKLFEVNKLRPR